MTDSIYLAFAVSVLRSLLLVAGGWLVSRGLAEDALMREVAAGLAIIIVTQVWGFVRIYRARLYARWLLVLGLEEIPEADQDARAAQERGIEFEARLGAKSGDLPDFTGPWRR